MNDIVKQTPQNNLPAMTESDLINVLQSSLYPGADVNSVRMVIDYCRASGLDPMQKPVHIVPMWDGKQGKMRDVVMPGVGLYRIQASRSGQFAGMTEVEYGPMVTMTLDKVDITVPEFARVTAKRVLDNGVIAEFTAIEYWIENYAIKGGKEKSIAPNAMWSKRPRGQIAKCAQAQALRLAFPELGAQPTAEEMEGKQFHDEAEMPINAELQALITDAQATTTDGDALKFWNDNKAKLAKNIGDYNKFKDAVAMHRQELKAKDEARTVDMPTDQATPDAMKAFDDSYAPE